ncbi:FxsA family protein [Halocatena pleomorpha]|uniref:Membrane protein FxsA n=1 Tax=Halocatena pleomorpha TaxID=1785090 RepID=A0A3P3RIT8_9EURY|nr:FxsA family protein [Halocatena pleomorpha]RRJ33467.1 membrane protein FxsA [Halocatena pleomorpha]
MKRIIALLLLIPLADIVLLVGVAEFIGPAATVLLVVLTALIGMLLVRAEGRHAIRRINTKLSSGEIPDSELVDGALLIAAGAFFLTPGLVTDLCGLLLVIPPTRYPVRLLLKKYVITPYLDGKSDEFITGTVYTGGFPNADTNTNEQTTTTYNLGEDEYSIDGDSKKD